MNFIDLDELESSVTAMEGNRHLGDLYMMGNPCQVRHRLVLCYYFEVYIQVVALPNSSHEQGRRPSMLIPARYLLVFSCYFLVVADLDS